ncbi:MAG: twin-arginine translocation signal domain-containing protein [Burkholderiales bacterium]|nr:twin-arginine translocation signal domain-containing protein [Burkholderiales bacterium]
MSQGQIKLSRRNFLFALGAGGAAGAAAIAAKTVPQAQPQADPSGEGKKKTRGYQASEHVRNYYRTAKV